MTLPNNPIFDFSLSGVSTDLSLGKNGPRLLNSNGAVEVATFDGQLGNLVAGQGFFANVGIGTAVTNYPLDVWGNIHIGNTATISGIVFADGTFQNTAGSGAGLSFGLPNTIQVAGNNNTFSGSSGFSFDILGNLFTLTGNLQIVNTASTTSGIVFPDGTFQDTAAANTPSFGPPGTMQFAGAGNTFSGNDSALFWSNSNSTLISSSLFLTSNVASTTYNTGALVVHGGVGIDGDMHVAGNIFGSNVSVITGNSGVFYGDTQGFGAIYGGIPMGYTYQPNTVLQLSANVNDYAQFNIQNINPRFAASTDIVATADNGTANDGYIDLGINSSQFFQATIDSANDGYLYVAGNAVTGGGNLVLGTLANNDIIFGQGGAAYGSEVARFVYGQGLVLELNTASYSPTTGALITAGGLGVAGNGNFAGNLSVSYGSTGQVSIGNDPNGRLEIGQQNRASSGVPYIDFHSIAGSGDYDTRIQSSGGNAAQSGQGTLNLVGALVAISSNLQAGGQALVNRLISNAGISGANLQIVGTAYLGNVYSNGFSQTAGLTITNGLISNTNIYGANLNIAGTAWTGNVYSNGTIQANGLAVVNQLISNANISGANLNITGTAWSGNVYSNGFSQTAGLAVVNQLISNTNIFGANLTIPGPANVGSLNSNGTIQADGTATVNALYSNTVVQTATINAVSSAMVNSLTSNLFIQTPGPLTAASVNSNGAVQAAASIVGNQLTSNTTIQAAGNIVAGAITSNSTIQSAGVAYLQEIYSNLNIHAIGTITGNALKSNTFVHAIGEVVGGSINSNTTIQAAGAINGQNIVSNATITAGTSLLAGSIISNATITAGTSLLAGSITSNSTIQSAGTTTVNALISNTNIYGDNLNIAVAAQVNSLTSNTTARIGGLATVDSLIVNNNSTTNTLVVQNSSQSGSISSNSTISGNGLISGQQIRSNGFVEGQTLKTTGLAVVNQFISNTEVTANTLNIISDAVVQQLEINAAIQSAGPAIFQTINSNTSVTAPGINALNDISGNTITSNVTLTAADIDASGVVILSNTTASGSTGSGALIVAGGVGISGNLNVGGLQNLFVGNVRINGNLFVAGNTTIINSNTTSVEGPTIEVGSTNGNAQPLTSNDGYDRGVVIHYYDINDNHAFMGWQNSSGRFVYLNNVQPGVANVFNPFESVDGYVYGTGQFGDLYLSNSTISINSNSGALVVSGGVGIGGDVNALGQIATTGAGRFGQDLLANQLNSNAAISAVGTITGSSLHANLEVSATNLSATNQISGYLIAANSMVTSAEMTATDYITGNVLVGNLAVVTADLQATGLITGHAIISNTSVTTTDLVAGGLVLANRLNANLEVAAQNISAVNQMSANVMVANVSVNSPIITASTQLIGQNIVANSTVFTTGLVTGGQAQVNALNSNTNVSATDISAVNKISANVITANVSLDVSNITVSNTLTANVIVGNLSITSPYVTASVLLTGNNIVSNGNIVTTQLTVGGLATVNSLISNTAVNAATLNSNVVNSSNIFTNDIYTSYAQVAYYIESNAIFSNTSIQCGGFLLADSIISNNFVHTDSLLASNFIEGQAIVSNSSITAAQTITSNKLYANNSVVTNGFFLGNSITSNTSVTAAGIISGGSLYSNTTVQAITAGLFGAVYSDSAIEATGSIIGQSLTSNSSIQASGQITAQNFVSNSSIQASGQITAQNFVSNSTIVSAGATTVNALVSNTTIQATGNATVGNLTTSGSITTTGSGGNIIGVNTLFTQNVIATGFINAPTFTSNTFISNSNIGIGTSTVQYPLDVYGNIHIGNTATTSGILFSDGSFQASAATNTRSFGPQYTMQFAGNANAFSGDSTNLFWDAGNVSLSTTNLTVPGNANVASNLGVGQNIRLAGNLNGSNTSIISGKTGTFIGGNGGFGALYAGVQDYTNYQPNTVALFAGNINSTSQINVHNDSNGGSASADIVVTADNGNAADTFIDLGINSSGWNQTTLDRANDGYLFMHGNTVTGGGNLVLGTILNNDIVFAQGGNSAANQVARFVYGQGLLINSAVNSANLNVASLVTNGGLAVGLDALVGGNITTGYGTSGTIILGGDPNGGIEIGQQGRATPGTPFIDFHSSTSSNDYDARILASGGSAAAIGQANLTLFASNVNVNANLTVYGNLQAYTADIGSFAQINSRGIANVQVLQSNGYVSGNTWVIDGSAINSNTTFQQTVDAWSISSFRSAHYMLQITDSTTNAYQASQLMLLQDGTDVFFTEYADIYTATSLGSWSANIIGGMVELLFTPNTSDDMAIKVVRTAIDL